MNANQAGDSTMTSHTTQAASSINNSFLLQGKHAVVFGAGGSIGAAVAKAFAGEGAEVFLAGRTKSKVEQVASQIVAADGRSHAAAIDTLDESAVNQYIDGIVSQVGKIDIVIDLTGPAAREYGNGKNALDLPVAEFLVPLQAMMKSRFITARSAARHMVKQSTGVIIFVTGSPARPHVPGATAIGAAFAAMENLTANLAFEISPSGVRVVCVRTVANVDSRSIQDTAEIAAGQLHITKEQVLEKIAQANFLKVAATVQDTANAAVLIASDRARMLTGTVVNASAGAALD
jgi:3-oxoacyl-[acyl-carrier protein] reductase